MAKIYNHNGKYGTTKAGKDKLRNMQYPDQALSVVDFADFQYSDIPLGITDMDAFINAGNVSSQINIIIEFKREALTDRYNGGYKHEAVPVGQRVAYEVAAKSAQTAMAAERWEAMDEEARRDTPLSRLKETRFDGTASMILLVSHPDEDYPSAAYGIVESVYWANDAFNRDAPDWQLSNYTGRRLTLAQYFDILSHKLYNEVPESRTTKKFRSFAVSALRESGQESLIGKA